MKCEFCNNKKTINISHFSQICLDCVKKHYEKNLKFYNEWSERNSKIIKLRLENKTYKEIGKIFGISLERARQIFCKCGRSAVRCLTKEKENKNE